MTMHQSKPTSRRVIHMLMLSLIMQGHVHAADIANVPLSTQSSVAVRANMMFIMDDSLSMSWGYLPDSVGNYSNLCFGFHGVNGVFYNPAVTYSPPLNADGTSFSNASFTAARVDGFDINSSVVDLSNVSNLSTPSTRVGGSNQNPTNSRYYYSLYASSNPATPACSGNGYNWSDWTIVTVLPVGQRTNYANWYSYYRTRMLTMRSAVGRAMNSIDGSRFRIGYSAISSNSYVSSSGFLPVSEFDQGTQKADFYAKLYAAPGAGFTPLRPALEKIGKYYAGRQRNGNALPSGAVDPLQYSCQRNYAMLTTDGYWNRTDEPSSNYVPTRIERTPQGATIPIGNPDAAAGVIRPRLDDGRLQGSNWVPGGPGVDNTLADIAMYFFDTDLRNPSVSGTSCTGAIANQDVCQNNVKPESPPFLPLESVLHQRMTTYALGLGIAGQLTYQAEYGTATSGSYAQLKSGAIAWPNPDPSSNGNSVITRADDLWHAAVNGRGRYYSASNPTDLATGLASALDTISSENGTGAAGATSSQKPVNGDNFAFIAGYGTVTWEGNVRALTIDTSTGLFNATPLWEAKNTLRAQVQASSDTRTILFRDTSVTGTQLAPFTYTNLNSTGLGTPFVNACATGNYRLSQCAGLVAQGAAVQSAANDGANLVNYLRGRHGLEDVTTNATTSRLFRARPHTPLGDIVNAAPAYIKRPPFRYTDAGYNTFAASNANRTGVLYVAANDGMLHALNATTGVEMWAYVPSMVMPNLYRLADANYDVNHRYFVDGTPIIGDVYHGGSWRTILVGGLGAGGRGYYALDITDPANPRSLWEFSVANDNDLGLTFGNPVITKNKAGVWVVAFSSGYNNVSPGDGNGHLFVRNAVTGAAIDKFSTFVSPGTPAGTAGSPSELGKINAWLDIESDNTARRMYGGDMKGNLWRFDFDDNIAPTGKDVLLLGRALTPGGAAQPITTIPILTKIGNSNALPAVAVGTGRYLGATDVGDQTLQSIYVFKDNLAATGLGTLRSNASMVQQTMVDAVVDAVNTRRVANPAAVDWATHQGWYVDLSLTPGERVNVDMQQTGVNLLAVGNTPSPSACNGGGTSWRFNFNVQNGQIIDAKYLPALLVGSVIYTRGDGGGGGGGGGGQLVQGHFDDKGNAIVEEIKKPPDASGGTRRTSWRELVF
jgi:type IV pilus assembly protein PilY1